MPLNLAAYDAALKEVYEKTIIDLTNSRTVTLDLFSKEQGSWEGREVTYPLNLNRNQGVMFTSENGTLPDAGSQQYAQVKVPIRFCHARIQLSIQVIKASKTSKGAFKRAMDQEMKGVVRDLTNDRNRAMMGWGLGVLAVVNGTPAAAATTINVKSPGGVSGTTNGNRFLQVNQNIAFVSTGGAIRADGARSVLSVSTDGASMVLKTALANPTFVVDTDYIVRAAKTTTAVIGDTAYNLEPTGLLALVDDSTYLTTVNNISRSTYPIFKSQVFPTVGALSADILQRGVDVADQIGNGEIKYFVCHHSVRRSYLTLMDADRRYMGSDLKQPDMGTVAAKLKDITFGDIPWKVDKDAPYGILFGVDPSSATRYVEVEGEWADDDGTILLRLTDVDAYEARFRVFDNFALDVPASCFRLDGITATVVVLHIN
jgi:hypothetical protein